jgi:hypothetical protein
VTTSDTPPTAEQLRERFRTDPMALAERLFWIGSLDPASDATRAAVRQLIDDSSYAANAWATGRVPLRADWWTPLVDAGMAALTGRRAPDTVTAQPTRTRRVPSTNTSDHAREYTVVALSSDDHEVPPSRTRVDPQVVAPGAAFTVRIDLTGVPMGHYTGVLEARPVDAASEGIETYEFDVYVDEASASAWR